MVVVAVAVVSNYELSSPWTAADIQSNTTIVSNNRGKPTATHQLQWVPGVQ